MATERTVVTTPVEVPEKNNQVVVESVKTDVVAVDSFGRAPGENVAQPPEPKVKPTIVTNEHIAQRVKEAKAKQAAQPPPPLRVGDWNGALQAISNLTARVNRLEAEKTVVVETKR